jgi:transposase
MWWLYASRAAPACARSLWCCSRFGSRVNRNVVARDKGTPVRETSTRLALSTAPSLGTPVMVPEATDTLTHVANHFGVWPTVLSRIERGTRRDDDLANAYRAWLNAA